MDIFFILLICSILLVFLFPYFLYIIRSSRLILYFFVPALELAISQGSLLPWIREWYLEMKIKGHLGGSVG